MANEIGLKQGCIMHCLFEITKDDVALLSDADLRELVGRLCEADYRSAGLPTSGIRYGGHQDARDGGLDVVVSSEVSPPKTSYVPRCNTGFQVKKSNMPRSEILAEMRPKGVLLESISDLGKSNGAYIIVSGVSSTHGALQKRIAAMHEAVSSAPDANNLELRFYDANQIATWLRAYPSLILWLREKIGRPISGWKPYGAWAYDPGNKNEPFLVDEKLRLVDGAISNDNGLSILDGLRKLRTELSVPGRAVRLAGLSGVGKTRFAQALFESNVGEQPIDPSLAIYADIGTTPDPAPCALADQLVAGATRACLIIDNCPPDLHDRLSRICNSGQGALSLLTIEYDIRDHLPEETSVFRLEPASGELLERLVRIRFPRISAVDAQSIAEFSGGNARIAIALGQTVREGESLSHLRDSELFDRLFQQPLSPAVDNTKSPL
jgi:hypothetical protein